MTDQLKGPKGWSDEHLAHMCKLSSIWAHTILSEGFDPTDIGDEHPQNIQNYYRILAETFVELQGRAGMKPSFTRTGRENPTADE